MVRQQYNHCFVTLVVLTAPLYVRDVVMPAGGEIFTKFGGWVNPANWFFNPFKDQTGAAERLAWQRLYGNEGIERVLKDILRKPG